MAVCLNCRSHWTVLARLLDDACVTSAEAKTCGVPPSLIGGTNCRSSILETRRWAFPAGPLRTYKAPQISSPAKPRRCQCNWWPRPYPAERGSTGRGKGRQPRRLPDRRHGGSQAVPDGRACLSTRNLHSPRSPFLHRFVTCQATAHQSAGIIRHGVGG